jgi:hypothetical protein
MKTLFLAWLDKGRTCKWFPVGRLDVEKARSRYHFRYVRGAVHAKEESGFEPLLDSRRVN